MEKFIIDASVGIKWFFNEEFQQEAIEFLEKGTSSQAKLVIPGIFYSEFMNACLKKVRFDLIKWSEASEAAENVLQLPLSCYPDKELSSVALENAYRFKISVYDAVYVSLAEVYSAPLVTADKALFDACHKRVDFIEYLGDFR